MKRKPPKLDKPYPRNRSLLPEEEAEWREAMGNSATPSPFRERAAPGADPLLNPPPEGGGDTKRRHKPAAKATTISHLDKPTAAKIRRGILTIDGKLDLHGHTRGTAHLVLEHFLAGAQDRGMRLVLVITGKGKKGGGTLREELPRWLNESPLREMIIAYDVAGPRHGAEGAWYVRIRKKK